MHGNALELDRCALSLDAETGELATSPPDIDRIALGTVTDMALPQQNLVLRPGIARYERSNAYQAGQNDD